MEHQPVLKILQDSTVWFIATDPTSVVLLRHSTLRTDTGASKPGPAVPLPAQQVKLIGNSESGISKGEGGEDRVFEYTVLFKHDGDVQIGDTFKLGTTSWTVYALEPNNGYELKARARQHSKKPTDG